MFTTTILLSSLLAVHSLAQTAHVVIEASRGGAGNNLRNSSINVPVNTLYSNASAFDEISTMFLTRAEGVPVRGITCTPYRYENGTGMAGLPFTFDNPSLLSTNTVQIGSMRCMTRGRTNDTGPIPPALSMSLSISTTSPPPALVTEVTGGLAMGPDQTVVDGTTTYDGPGTTYDTNAVPLSTVTPSASASGGDADTTMMSSTTAASSTSGTGTAAPEQQTDGAAGHITPRSGLVGVLIAALGFGMAL